MTQRPSAILILPLLSLLGCATGPEIHFTPSGSDAIEVLMRSEAVPMDVHPSCKAIALRDGVPTIGAYVSAVLALQSEGGENWSETVMTSEEMALGKVWQATVTFHAGKARRVDVVQFHVLQKTARVIPDSFRCKSSMVNS
jgi:hypothetical protein